MPALVLVRLVAVALDTTRAMFGRAASRNRQAAQGAVYVTHDQVEAMTLADWIGDRCAHAWSR